MVVQQPEDGAPKLSATMARVPDRFMSLLSAPPSGVRVTWQHLRLDDTDRSDAVEVSWAVRPAWWAAAAVGVGVLVWYTAGLLLLFRFLAHPVLGPMCLFLTVLPPIAAAPWLSWHLSGSTRLLFTPDRRLCLDHGVSVLGMYTARVSSLDTGRAAVRAIGVLPRHRLLWRPWAREMSVVGAGDGVELHLGCSARAHWLADLLSAWSGAPSREQGRDTIDREEATL